MWTILLWVVPEKQQNSKKILEKNGGDKSSIYWKKSLRQGNVISLFKYKNIYRRKEISFCLQWLGQELMRENWCRKDYTGVTF